MRILIVDDDKIIRMGLSKKIKRLFNEYEVICDFQNGKTALEFLQHEKVDLVITDIKMPIMTGTKLISESMRSIKNPPIFVVLSGYDDFSYVRESMKVGAFDYLLKPIREEDLVNTLKEVEKEIVEKKQNSELINKSIEVLRKEFFKFLLFSNKEMDENKYRETLHKLNLDNNLTYQLITVNNYDKGSEKCLKVFLKKMLVEYKDIKCIYFLNEANIYIVFYYDKKLINEDEFLSGLSEKSNMLIEEGMGIYILETVDTPYDLKDSMELVRKFKTQVSENIKIKKYFLKKNMDILEDDKEEEKDAGKMSIKLAKDYIINNYNNNITLKDVADEIYLSQNYLSELFKKETGEGFYEFLSNYRIKKSKEILLTTNLRIYEVAEAVGYSDSITFGRAFKRKTGVTPNRYRNGNISNDKEELEGEE
ncbi:MAG: response regulator [Clostridium sp.]|nr:response regulator [Clostridium sp.]